MSIHDFEKEQAKLLKDKDIRKAWLDYLSGTRTKRIFRSAEQYDNQISIVNGKKAGTDLNLYKLFVEQCFRLLRAGGSAASSLRRVSTPTLAQSDCVRCSSTKEIVRSSQLLK